MLGVFLTRLGKWGHPQPGKLSIPTRRPLSVQLLPWFYHGNSYWRDRANRNLPKVQERTLRHRSNELCRAVWRPHWPFMQKHLVRPQFATGFQKAPFGRRTMTPKQVGRAPRIDLELSWSDDHLSLAIFQVQLCRLCYTVQCTLR